nr:DoxX family membrane protein [Candidatus Woesearchaeota archaeon]
MKVNYILGFLRISLGFIFLWAFLDKLFGLNFLTPTDKSWLLGVSPTFGFLSNSQGPFSGFYKAIAGNILVDWLFMLGLLLIGLALILGIFMKIASYSGSLMLILIYLASLPLVHNPIIDEHIIYILILILLPYLKSGHYLGFGRLWSRTSFVRKYNFLE